MRILRIAAALLVVLGGIAMAQQGQVSQQPGSQQSGEVTVGAGTTSDVTTGSSGEGSGSGDETIQPVDVDMPYPEQPEGLLGTPGSLAIQSPRQLRCDIIEDEAARNRCETTDVSAAD